jgi:hypothetical protein
VDGPRFDQLIKHLATTRLTRLSALRGLAAGAVASLTGLSLLGEDGGAKDKGKRTRKRRICHRTSANDPGVSKKLKAKRARRHLRKHPFDTKGRCAALPGPAPTPPLPPGQCQAGQTACGQGCCPNSAPLCCGGVGGEALSCWAAGNTCCSAVGGTGACPGGAQCCAGSDDAANDAFAQTYCIDAGEECCPFVETGACDRQESESDPGFFQAFFCCRAPGESEGTCCAGREIDGTVQGGCCDVNEQDCPDGFFCFDSGFGVGCCVFAPSDRALKANLASIDPVDMLARVRELPITTWNYTTDDPAIRHIGPMAQDFAASFGVGADDRYIHLIDGQGVALAAIQGLAAELERLRSENATLAARLAALEGDD